MLCLVVANQNNRTNVLPEPAAQMTRGDKLAAPLCPPVTMGSALPGALQEDTAAERVFCLEEHLGNGMKCMNQMLSQCHHCMGVAKFS